MPKSIPIISVITAVYNDEKYIQKSVESILNQTFTDFEYIIVDDGSTDNTLSILNEISKEDERVIILSQENSGAALARNLAINSAKGVYIALQDSDDISSPDRLQLQFEQLTNSNVNLISCTGYKIIDPTGNVIATHNKIYQNINGKILNGNTCACHPSIMLPRALLLNVRGYNSFYKKTEDYDLILRLLENNGYLEKINSCLYFYRIRENSESSMHNGEYKDRAYENHFNRVNGKPENFKEVVNDHRIDKNYVLKRQTKEVFFSENYSEYIKLYTKIFYKLPVNNYLLYFIFSFFPFPLKKLLKRVFY